MMLNHRCRKADSLQELRCSCKQPHQFLLYRFLPPALDQFQYLSLFHQRHLLLYFHLYYLHSVQALQKSVQKNSVRLDQNQKKKNLKKRLYFHQKKLQDSQCCSVPFRMLQSQLRAGLNFRYILQQTRWAEFRLTKAPAPGLMSLAYYVFSSSLPHFFCSLLQSHL